MYYLGIDLGGTNIAAGVVDENGNLLYKDSIKTFAQRHYTEIVADIAAVSKKVCEDFGITIENIKSIGIGSPGTINSKDGVVVYTNNINFENTPIRKELQKHIDLPVFISNDANCAALGETISGAAKGHKNVIMLTLGTGVGGGIIIDGKIYEGDFSAGAELGHSVIVVDGEMCTCGRKGCFEAYCSATALIRQTEKAIKNNRATIMNEIIEHNIENVNGKTAFIAARKGDESANKVVENYIRFLSEGIVNIVNIFRPEVIIIGGGISYEGEYMLNPIREFVSKYSYGGSRTPIPLILSAKLGNDAGIIGAAMLAK